MIPSGLWEQANEDPRGFCRGLAQLVREEPLEQLPSVACGVDVAYVGDEAWAAAVVLDPRGGVVAQATAYRAGCAPYRPSAFFLREAPVVLEVLSLLPIKPPLLFVHGHGRAHPLGAGLACAVGVLADIPTVGCAGEVLVGEAGKPPEPRGSWTPLAFRGATLGALLRTRVGVKPVVVSVGHRTSLQQAVALVLAWSSFRFPEPLRQAHQLANAARRAGGRG